MVNTLRITSVVAILIAGVLVLLVVGPKSVLPNLLAKFAMGSDEEAARILDAPSVVDRFIDSQGNRNQARQDATPPLVKQAEVFAGILTPAQPAARPSTRQPGTATRPTRPVIKPGPSTAKFNLVGTAYAASDPDGSFAYIHLADDTYQWVRRGDEVGHLVVKEVRNRSIICSDGHGDQEISVEAAPETASLLETPGAAAVETETDETPVPTASGRITGPAKPRQWTPSQRRPSPRSPALRSPIPGSAGANISPEERDKLEELAVRLRESGAGGSAADRAAMMKAISEFKASRVSPEEAEEVEDLGRELNESQQSAPDQKRTNLRRKLDIPGRNGR